MAVATKEVETTEAVEETQDSAEDQRRHAEDQIERKMTEIASRKDDGDEEELSDDAGEEAAKTAEEETTPDLDDDLLDRALDLGLTERAARALGEDLEKTLERLEKKVYKPTDDGKSETAEATPRHKPYKPSLNEDAVEPELIQEFSRLYDSVRAEFASELESLKREVSAESERQQQTSFEDRVNGMISERDRWSDVLGEGKSPGGKFARKRAEVVTEMEAMIAGRKARNLNPLPDTEVLDRVLHALYHEHAQSLAAKETAEALKKRQKQHLSRPGGSKTNKPLSGTEEAAIENIDRKLKEIGFR